MLLNKDPASESISGIVWENGHYGLKDNRTGIRSLVNKMSGTTGKPDSVVEGLLLSVGSWK